MPYLIVNAEDVRIDDQIYMGDDFAKNERHRWGNVKKVKRKILHVNNQKDTRIVITAGGCDSWFHPKDGVQIERFDLG